MIDDSLMPYGIDAATGRTWRASTKLTRPPDARIEYEKDLQSRWATRAHLGPSYGVDPSRLDEAGWAVLLPEGSDPSLRQALEPLLSLRRQEAGDGYREMTLMPGESKARFLARFGARPGPADPQKMPYYILIVADPEEIPFSFQRQLDVQYAVGRLHFDNLENYRRYAESVVAIETKGSQRRSSAAFFSPVHADDPASRQLCTHVMQPLVYHFEENLPDWQAMSLLENDASKVRLLEILQDASGPALFFAATHGLVYRADHPQQIQLQGSLLCQEWPGPVQWRGPIRDEFSFSANDVDDRVHVQGMIALLLSSFSVGVEKYDEYSPPTSGEDPVQLAPRAFVSNLAQTLLAQGALAVWGTVADSWHVPLDSATVQGAVFESVIRAVAEGVPIGFALEYIDQRYAELATQLVEKQQSIAFGRIPDKRTLASLWSSYVEFRNVVLLGDPATRLSTK